MREDYPYVDGCKFIEGQELLSDINLTLDDVVGFREFFADNIAVDPYSNVRIRGMLKLEYDYMSCHLSKAQVQSYFQSADANNLNGGSARTFNIIDSELLSLPIFKALFAKHEPLIRQYCERNDVPKAQLSIHFIRYQANKGEASYSSPVWLHKDDEPIVFIHLVNLTDNALGADNVIAGMDDLPTKVIRLTEFMDCLIVDPTLKHAVTPVGSKSGVARRDVMLVNLEDPSRQGGYA